MAVQILVLGAVLLVIGTLLDLGYGVLGGSLHGVLTRHAHALPRARVGVGLTYLGSAP